MTVSSNGHIEIVRLLIESGADVNAKDNINGCTALIWASSKGSTEIVRLLFENGADVNVKSNSGLTALKHAKANYRKEIVEILEQVQNQNQ